MIEMSIHDRHRIEGWTREGTLGIRGVDADHAQGVQLFPGDTQARQILDTIATHLGLEVVELATEETT